MDDSKSAPSPSEKPASGFLSNYIVPTNLTQGQHTGVVIVLFLLSLLILNQTRMCTQFMGSIFVDKSTLDWHVNKSMQLRREVVAKALGPNSVEPSPAVTPHSAYFGEGDDKIPVKRINDTIKLLYDDPKVRDTFPSLDKVPLIRTSAVVVPLWRIPADSDRRKMGITDAGWVCSDDDSTPDPGAITIREKPVGDECLERLRAKAIQYDKTEDGNPQMTKDGIPRIALSKYPLENTEVLKLTLLHEFMHAHNAPPYRPFLNFVHDDLTYLSEYNTVLSNAGLLEPWSFKWNQEAVLWVVLVILTVGMAVNAYLAGWLILPKPFSKV